MNFPAFTRRRFLGLAVALSLCALSPSSHAATAPNVAVRRVPDGGLQPQVVVVGDTARMVYFKGDPKAGNIFYAKSTNGGASWTAPLQVNSGAGSAIAMGTIRGPMLAVGRRNRVFVVWNGSDQAVPRNTAAPASAQKYGAAPLLFARLNDAGDGFETQRNLLTQTWELDGGASVAADDQGRVYLAWHAVDREGQDETKRRVYLSVSSDDGATFAPEKSVWDTPTGACACCQVALKAENGGRVALLYRSATELVHRDSYLLQSGDGGKSFRGQVVSEWNINACPMSRYALESQGNARVIGWESAEKVYFARLDGAGQPTQIVAAPGTGKNRKYPSLAVGTSGAVLFVWTEGTGWNRGGSLKFQVFDSQNQPQGELGQQSGVPTWSFATAFAHSDGFTVLY